MNSRYSRFSLVLVLGLVGGMIVLTAQPASAGLFKRKIVIIEPPPVVAVPAAPVATSSVVVSAPAPTVLTVPTIVSGPVQAVYTPPLVPTTQVVEPAVAVPAATTYSGVVPTAYGTTVVVRPVERVKVVYPRRVYRYRY